MSFRTYRDMILNAAMRGIPRQKKRQTQWFFFFSKIPRRCPRFLSSLDNSKTDNAFVRKFTSFTDGADAVSRIAIDAMYSIASLCQASLTVKSGTSRALDAGITIGEGRTIELSRTAGCSKAVWRSKGLPVLSQTLSRTSFAFSFSRQLLR
jgi:hypothetical protein